MARFFRRVLLISLIFALILSAFIGFYFYFKFHKIFRGETYTYEDVHGSFEFKEKLLKESTPPFYVAVFGVDKRYEDEKGRSDTNILVKVDFNNNKIKLVSVMRDLYVEIPEYGMDKFNSAFAYGGPKLALSTLNKNLGLGITKYVIVDFSAFEEVIDAVGGVEIEVKPEEVEQLNLCIKELARLAKDNYTPLVYKAGTHLLNGRQALGYSRIRKVGNGDYERVERQQRVLRKAFEKVKSLPITKKMKLLDIASKSVETNLTISELSFLAQQDYKNYSFETMRIPVSGSFEETTRSIGGLELFVLNADMEKNRKALYDFLSAR